MHILVYYLPMSLLLRLVNATGSDVAELAIDQLLCNRGVKYNTNVAPSKQLL